MERSQRGSHPPKNFGWTFLEGFPKDGYPPDWFPRDGLVGVGFPKDGFPEEIKVGCVERHR